MKTQTKEATALLAAIDRRGVATTLDAAKVPGTPPATDWRWQQEINGLIDAGAIRPTNKVARVPPLPTSAPGVLEVRFRAFERTPPTPKRG